MAEGAAASMEGLNIQEQAPAEGQPKPTVILVIGAEQGCWRAPPAAAACRRRLPFSNAAVWLVPPHVTSCAAHSVHHLNDSSASLRRAGMAGSGKTTFLQRLNAHLHASQHPGYIVNLDPAVMHVRESAASLRAMALCCRLGSQFCGTLLASVPLRRRPAAPPSTPCSPCCSLPLFGAPCRCRTARTWTFGTQ